MNMEEETGNVRHYLAEAKILKHMFDLETGINYMRCIRYIIREILKTVAMRSVHGRALKWCGTLISEWKEFHIVKLALVHHASYGTCF
jgi:hypothetical protein